MIPLSEINKDEYKSGLYVISTPIGNLNDITLRAIDILKKSSCILCEDTRVSRKLLERYKIKSKLISNHKFNERKNLDKIIEILKSKKIVSIISDAGTPTISDPGSIIINQCIKSKINIYPIPGASAVTAAVSVSGFSDRYFFYGFFPEKKKILNNDLKDLSKMNCSIVFFISPNKINNAIIEIKNFFSGRNVLICREISKFYEEYLRSKVEDLKPYLRNPKGELTVVISGQFKEKNVSKNLSESDKKNISKIFNKLSIKDIVKLIGKDGQISKKEIYNYCLSLKK